MNLRLLSIYILSVFILSCTFSTRVYDWNSTTDLNEQVRIIQNETGLKLKWKKNIGTIRPTGRSSEFIVGAGFGVLEDQVYFQDRSENNGNPRLNILDEYTGNLKNHYPMPAAAIACLDCIIMHSSEKYLIPLKYKTDFSANYLIEIDPEKEAVSVLQERYPESSWYYQNRKIVWGGQNWRQSNHFASVYDLDTQREVWSTMPFAKAGTSAIQNLRIDLDGDMVFLYHQKHSNDMGVLWEIAAIDQSDGNLLWAKGFQSEQEYQSDRKGFQNWFGVRFGKDVYVIQVSYSDVIKDWDGVITALDRKTGEVLWIKRNILPVAIDQISQRQPLYVWKVNKPDYIFQLDFNTGDEISALKLNSWVRGSSVLVSSGIIVYIKKDGEKSNSLRRYYYAAVSEETGDFLWELDSNQEFNGERLFPYPWPLEFPTLVGSTLYFGDLWTGRTAMPAAGHLPFKMYPAAENSLMNEATAVDIRSGKVIWKIKIESREKPLIEKIIVKDEMIFIKSIGGWLYAFNQVLSKICVNQTCP